MKYIDDFILDRVNSKKDRLESMLLDKKSLKRIQWDILVEYVYISNKIEGSSLSIEETREILDTSHDILGRPTYYQHLSINHANAFEFIRQNVKNEITNQMVKEIHTVVMKNIDKEAGKYRDKNNINNRLEGFLRKLNISPDYHPIEKSALIQGFFHQIRPFNYGTGTTSRLLSKWMLNQHGYIFGLPLNPYEVKYYRKCAEKAGKGTIYPLVNMMTMCVEETLDKLISQVKSLNITPIEVAMRNNNLNPAQMLESIKRGEFKAFKKDGSVYVTDVRVDQLTHGAQLAEEIQ